MKRFMLRLALFIPLLILVIGINLYVDPANLFREGYEKGIAEILYSGRNVEKISNYDERLLQKYYIDLLESPKNTIILGSSRSMNINSKVLSNDNIFNNCVSGGSLEDYMAIYGMYRKKNILPKKIIIGVDPWIFNKNSGQHRWKSISEYYYYTEGILGYENSSDKGVNNKYLELISLKYFQTSIKNIFKERVRYIATTEEEAVNNVKISDGSLVYGNKIRNISAIDADKEASKYISGEIYSLSSYSEMDKEYLNKFIEFIDLLKADGIDITLFLSPYHPKVYDFLEASEKYSIIVNVEEYLIKFAEKNNILVIGSYNPVNTNQGYLLTNVHFYDGMHPKDEAVYIMFKDHFK